MKQPIRYFSIGLIVAGIALFVVHNYFDKPQANIEDSDIDTLISKVEANGFHVMEESEYIRLSVLNDSSEEDETKDENKDKNKDENKEIKENEKEKDKDKDEDTDEETTVKYSITIKPDMLPTDVTNLLEKEKIIKDASDFNKYLEDNDLSRLIQIGTFDVSSDMNQKEVAKVITRTN